MCTFEPDGIQFISPVTISLVYPPGLRNPRIETYDDDNERWITVPSTVQGDRVVFSTNHFSDYAIVGDPPTSTPASSSWSLAALAVVGLVIAGTVLRSRRSAREAA
jgi:hypothetical protein